MLDTTDLKLPEDYEVNLEHYNHTERIHWGELRRTIKDKYDSGYYLFRGSYCSEDSTILIGIKKRVPHINTKVSIQVNYCYTLYKQLLSEINKLFNIKQSEWEIQSKETTKIFDSFCKDIPTVLINKARKKQ